MITKTSPKPFLGAQIPNVKVLSSKIDEIIDTANALETEVVTDEVTTSAVSTATLTATGVSQLNTIVESHTATAKNITASVTAAELATGLITSTSAATVSLTLPTATELATALGAARGTSFEFIVDNSAGANTITVVVNTGITVNTPAITGGATLTVSTANSVAIFRVVFTSTTTAKILRIA